MIKRNYHIDINIPQTVMCNKTKDVESKNDVLYRENTYPEFISCINNI